MTHDPFDPSASDPLDQVLGAWAATQRLDEAESSRILAAIVGQAEAAAAGSRPSVGPLTPTGSLPATWWSDLSLQVASAVVLAARRSGPGIAITTGTPAAA
jgi:hypothetical protein